MMNAVEACLSVHKILLLFNPTSNHFSALIIITLNKQDIGLERTTFRRYEVLTDFFLVCLLIDHATSHDLPYT